MTCVAQKRLCLRSLLTFAKPPCCGPPTSAFAFRISFQPDWQIDNDFFNRPIMASTQILIHRRRPRTRISALGAGEPCESFLYIISWLNFRNHNPGPLFAENLSIIFTAGIIWMHTGFMVGFKGWPRGPRPPLFL